MCIEFFKNRIKNSLLDPGNWIVPIKTNSIETMFKTSQSYSKLLNNASNLLNIDSKLLKIGQTLFLFEKTHQTNRNCNVRLILFAKNTKKKHCLFDLFHFIHFSSNSNNNKYK